MAAAAAMKRLVPLFDRIVVQKAEPVTQTGGGIVLPDKAQAKVLRGTVIAIGPGERNDAGKYIPPQVQVGDEVLLPDYGGTMVRLGDQQEVYVYKESSILAKLEI